MGLFEPAIYSRGAVLGRL